MTKTIKRLLSLAFCLLVLFGCGDSSDYSDVDYESGINSGVHYESSDSLGEVNDYASDSTSKGTIEQKIIVDTEMNIETKKFDETMEMINNAIKETNAYVQSSNVDNRYETYENQNLRYAYMKVRVPAENLDKFMNYAEKSGNVISTGTSTEDVTTEYYDIQAQIDSLKAQEERLQEMYDEAKTINDLINIESRLSDVRSRINRYEMTIKNYDLLTKYSTVDLRIEEVSVLTEVSDNFFSQVCSKFVESFVSFGDVLKEYLFVLILALPYILFFGTIAILINILNKKRREKFGATKRFNKKEQKKEIKEITDKEKTSE